MGKLNRQMGGGATAADRIKRHPDATTNYEGGLAFTTSPEAELYMRCASCLWQEPKFYGGQPQPVKFGEGYVHTLGDTERAIWELANSVDPQFVLRLAKYVRQELNLRTVAQVLLTIVANRGDLNEEDHELIRRLGPSIMSRADEVKEVVALQFAVFTSSIPRPLRTAIATRMEDMSQYEAMKYAGGQGLNWHDVLNYVHPKPVSDYTAALWRWMVTGDIDNELLPEIAARKRLNQKSELDNEALRLAEASNATWEVLVSQFGNKREVWEAASLPYMATLRNLRNMIEAGVDIEPHLEKISDPEQVRRSRQLPFRFWSALETAGKATADSAVSEAIRAALDVSVENLTPIPGMTAIFVDLSGSMSQPISRRSTVMARDIAALMGAIAHGACEKSVVGCFGSDFQFVHPDRSASVLTNMQMVNNTRVGGSTNAHLGVDALTQGAIPVDRIILLSDMQCYDSTGWGRAVAPAFVEYRNRVNRDCRLISVNLVGYGTVQFPEDDPNSLLLAGWSERIFDLIGAWESGGGDALDKIAAVE